MAPKNQATDRNMAWKVKTSQIAEATEEAAWRKSAPGRAMRVAAALKAKGGDEFAKPGSIIEIKFVKGESLSLTASRLLALMISDCRWRCVGRPATPHPQG
jgi:hypothetical protein